MMSNIRKPCIRQCCLDEDDICMGCYRTFEDMRVWHAASEKEKLQILHLAKERKLVYAQKCESNK